MSLLVLPQGASLEQVSLRAMVYTGEVWDLALLGRADGAQVLSRARFPTPQRRVQQNALLRPEGLLALDEAEFAFEAQRFAELGRRHSGASQPSRPIELPPTLRIGQRHHPFGGAAFVELAWAGSVILRQGEAEEQGLGALLRAGEGDRVAVQWMLEGVGEIAIGPEGQPFQRWLAAWTGGDRRLFGGVDPALAGLPWPELPRQTPRPHPETLF